jgi:hypothetical protein
MYGAFGSWGWPGADRVAAFEDEYTNNYLPLVRKVPHIASLQLLQADDSGRESDVYRIGVMWFRDEQTFHEASSTQEWAAMFAYCDSLIERYQVPMRFAYVRDDAVAGA